MNTDRSDDDSDRQASAEAPISGKAARSLTGEELARVLDAVARAAGPAALIESALRAVYDALLPEAARGDDASGGAGQRRINPADWAIPASQWQAITAAIVNRAAEWGAGATVAFELINLMPSTYEDPDAPAPEVPHADYRPPVCHLEVSREATDVIAACEAHLQALGGYFGWRSQPYLDAFDSWHRQLAGLFGMGLGARTRVSKDGERSLLVCTASGITFGVIFHGARRRCLADNCAATIGDDGRACPPYQGAPVLDHEHTPSYPLDAPQPGEWSFHS
jgi:hypothetical protein